MPLSFRPVEEQLDAGERRFIVDAGTIDVWGLSLEGSRECEERCRNWLSGEEHQRAGRLVRHEDRRRYIFAHGGLRALVGRSMQLDPAALVFCRGIAGKPALCETTHGSDVVAFSMSHACDRALIALSRHREIGIDLESLRAIAELDDIAARHYAPSERAILREASEADRTATFFRYWVAKEAVLKAQGIGLPALSECEIRVAKDGSGAEVVVAAGSPIHEDWRIRLLACGDGWAAAVAARGTDWVVRHDP